MIGCACAVCTSTDPRDTRLRSGACLRFTDPTGQERVILIDATPDLRQQALTHKIQRCDAILFTHNHVDHTFGLDEVRRFNVVQRAPVSVYADAHTTASLRRVYQHIFDRAANVNDSFVADVILWPMQAFEAFDLYGVRVTPIRLLHGRLPILGFRFDAAWAKSGALPLAYCTDVSAVPPETWPHLEGLGTLVLDALRHKHHPTHLTVNQAVGIAERVGAQATYFTHIAHDLSHSETDATLPEGMNLGFDGLSLE